MDSVDQYFMQQFPDAWMSEVLYQGHVISGATSVAMQKYNKEGALWLAIIGIIVTSTDLGTLVTFTDSFNRLIMRVHANGNSTGFYPTPLRLKTDTLQVNANFANANFAFTVVHQYARITDIKNPNRLPAA